MKLNQVLSKAFIFLKKNKALVTLLILVDFVFILMHCFLLWNIIDYNLNFSIEKDLGYAEFYQYLKEFGILSLLLYLFYKQKQLIYLVWAIIFLYLLLDDSLSIHENYGFYLADYLNIQPKFNLRPEDFGELLFFAFFAFLFFISIVFAFLKADLKGKLITKKLFLLFLILAFFGICIDLFHIVIPYGKNQLALIEDGGEMVVMSFIFVYVFSFYYSEKVL
ncbi:hypothetical protein L3X37_11990 [Sabulilitoribacter arenilitoris]|uniref:Uncharacterized protein n=1 Tax=Wocania arenilitoris TaxID=2044858 RepID=A0AAE3JQD0_9FLAO|nr:hypothetical protein [Wocania arenilitoris]MCF7569080.1 hypothetical protein [Wocania arenilitoris]